MAFDLGAALKDVSKLDTGREQIEYIRLEQIEEDPNNFYQLSDVENLAANIELCGLQQPIRVRPIPEQVGRYMIVSGHRRRKALELLTKDDPDRWGEVACIVQRETVSAALQQLQLIYANANTRTMTSAETSEQAVQVEKLLYQLKEEGYEFPGRMRDHVAQAVGASKSKLARLKVIRENLDDSWADVWKDGSLTESQAYTLAQMPPFWQSIIKEKWGYSITILYADTIARFRKRFEDVQKLKCQHGLTICEHTVKMMEKNVCSDWSAPCTGCCFDCDRLQNCGNCCPEASSKKEELKAVAKKAQLDAKLEQEERDRPGAEFARLVWQRAGLARVNCGATVEAAVLARGESFYSSSYDDQKQQKMENGEGEYTPRTPTPFGFSIAASDLMKVVAVADTLQCSVDYLLGRTEIMQLGFKQGADETELVSNSGTMWHPISEEPPTGVNLVWLDGCGYSDTAKYLGCQQIESVSTIHWDDARHWAFLPKED